MFIFRCPVLKNKAVTSSLQNVNLRHKIFLNPKLRLRKIHVQNMGNKKLIYNYDNI